MNILRFIIYRSPIFILLVIILPIIAGMFAYSTLPKEGEPEISAPIAIVVTLYQGASPLEIENLVTHFRNRQALQNTLHDNAPVELAV